MNLTVQNLRDNECMLESKSYGRVVTLFGYTFKSWEIRVGRNAYLHIASSDIQDVAGGNDWEPVDPENMLFFHAYTP